MDPNLRSQPLLHVPAKAAYDFALVTGGFAVIWEGVLVYWERKANSRGSHLCSCGEVTIHAEVRLSNVWLFGDDPCPVSETINSLVH